MGTNRNVFGGSPASFDEAFPGVADVEVVLTLSATGVSQQVRFDRNTLRGDPVRCPLAPKCQGGGFDVVSQLHSARAAGETVRAVKLMCCGEYNVGRRKPRCSAVAMGEIRVTYRQHPPEGCPGS